MICKHYANPHSLEYRMTSYCRQSPGWVVKYTQSMHYSGSSIRVVRRVSEFSCRHVTRMTFRRQHDEDKGLRESVCREGAPRREGAASVCPQLRRCQAWLQASCGLPASAHRTHSCCDASRSTHTPAGNFRVHRESIQALLYKAHQVFQAQGAVSRVLVQLNGP